MLCGQYHDCKQGQIEVLFFLELWLVACRIFPERVIKQAADLQPDMEDDFGNNTQIITLIPDDEGLDSLSV